MDSSNHRFTPILAAAALASAGFATAACAGGSTRADSSVGATDATRTSHARTCSRVGGTVHCVIRLSGTISTQQLASRIRNAPAGPLEVRPVPGKTLTVKGENFRVPRGRVTLANLRFEGTVTFGSSAGRSRLINSSALGFSILGPDDIVISGNRLDGRGRVANNIVWDAPGGVPERFVIRKNVFRNYFDAANPRTHSEALFIGFSGSGIIDQNVFVNNGNTAHIFFSWFGSRAEPSRTWPRNICVRANRFGATHDAYYDINFREEIPAAASKIRVDPPQRASLAYRAYSKRC